MQNQQNLQGPDLLRLCDTDNWPSMPIPSVRRSKNGNGWLFAQKSLGARKSVKVSSCSGSGISGRFMIPRGHKPRAPPPPPSYKLRQPGSQEPPRPRDISGRRYCTMMNQSTGLCLCPPRTYSTSLHKHGPCPPSARGRGTGPWGGKVILKPPPPSSQRSRQCGQGGG